MFQFHRIIAYNLSERTSIYGLFAVTALKCAAAIYSPFNVYLLNRIEFGCECVCVFVCVQKSHLWPVD